MGDVTTTGRYVQRPDLLVRHAPGFVALARVEGSSITLEGSGAAVWELLHEPNTVSEIADELARLYDAEPAQIATDIEPLLVDLAESGYVTVDE